MQNQKLTTKQFLGMIVLFLVMEWGMVAWFIMDAGIIGGAQKVGEGKYDALLATMNTESSDISGDFYDLLLTMNTEPQAEGGE